MMRYMLALLVGTIIVAAVPLVVDGVLVIG